MVNCDSPWVDRLAEQGKGQQNAEVVAVVVDAAKRGGRGKEGDGGQLVS